MGKAELPLHAPGTQVDSGYIGQSVPRPNAQRLLQGRGAFTDDLRFPRLAHVAFFRSPYAHARIKKLDFSKALEAARRHRRLRRPRGRRILQAVGRGARAPEGHQVAAAARDRDRARLLAGRGRGGGGRRVAHRRPRTRSQLIEAEWEELPVVVDMEDALARRNRHPPGSRRQHLLPARARHRRRGRASSPRPTWWWRTPSTSAATPASASRGARSSPTTTPAEHSLTVYHATQAPHMMQDIFSRHLGIPEAQRAGDREGRRRLLRHQGARLPRRDGHRGALGDAAPAGEVRRRPAGIVPVRHPRARASSRSAACLHQSGRNPRVRSRRPDRDRPVLGVPAHQRHRGQPGRQPHRRPLQAPASTARG